MNARTLSALAIGLLLAACASPTKQAPSVATPKQATSNDVDPAALEANVLEEAKKTAVTQLECPAEEVSVTCTRHDVHGGCVAVQARGCGRTLEYDFGND
jgi:hypothetical protein